LIDSDRNITILASSYLDIKKHVINKGYAWEIDWQENLCFHSTSESEFLSEAAWVILSSGMSVKSVQSVFNSVSSSFHNWQDSKKILQNGDQCKINALKHFNHKGKINAILSIIENVDKIGFQKFKVELKHFGVEYLQQFSFFGPATSFHLAKNIGMDVVKPDRHLQRLAHALNFSNPSFLCSKISNAIEEKIGVIDVVLWRYCVLHPNYLRMINRYKERHKIN